MKQLAPLIFIPILGIMFIPCAKEDDPIDNIFLVPACIIYQLVICTFFLSGFLN